MLSPASCWLIPLILQGSCVKIAGNLMISTVLALTHVKSGLTLNPRGGKELRPYQSVLILKPDFDETQIGECLEKITDLIKSQGGACLKVDKWGKKRLAYKVKKNRFGYYLNIYHTCENEKVPSLEAKYKLYEAIIKFMVLRLDDKELERAMSNGDEAEESAAPAEVAAKKDESSSSDKKEEVTSASDKKEEVASAEASQASEEKKEGGE